MNTLAAVISLHQHSPEELLSMSPQERVDMLGSLLGVHRVVSSDM